MENSGEHLERMAFLFPEVLKLLVSEMNTKECELPIPHRRIIHVLGEQGAMTMSDLSKSIGVETSTMTAHIDALVKNGYIERLRSEDDRRIVRVQLTPEGYTICQELLELLKKNISAIMNKLSVANQNALRGAFEQLYMILQEGKNK